MKTRLSTRVLSLLLVAALLVGMMPAVYAESSRSDVTITQVDNSAVSVNPLQPSGEAGRGTEDYTDTDVVRVSILLEKDSTIRAGFSTQGIAANEAAIAYRESLKQDQKAVVQKIERAIGSQLDVVWNLTLAANLISANVPYGQIKTIEQIPGVRGVVLENQYLAEPVEVSEIQPNMATSGAQTGSGLMWDAGYTGAGSRIAVIDTGTDTNHQSLNDKAFEYALAQIAQEKGMSYEDYVATLDLLDAEEIAQVGSQLNMVDYLDVEAAYFNTKLPFGFNYQDADYDITHDNDEEGEHGSHVAGIATANSWLYNAETDTYGKAMDYCFMQGVAPEAQLLTMKVFGKAGAPTDADYFAAIEDAIILGADVVNLSLGSVAPGRGTHNIDEFQSIMDDLSKTDTVVAISAGNSGPWAEYAENGGYLYSTDVSQDTVGQPGSFTNSLAVASVENDGMIGFYIDVAGQMIVYNEDNREGQFTNQPFTSIAGEHEYIFLDGVGKAEDWAAVADVLPGKIALCSRGETNFVEKAALAVQAGAIAVFIYNNQSGVITLDLTEYQYTNPVAALTQAQGAAIRAASTPVLDENGNVKYLTGKMTVSNTIGMGLFDSEYYTMSDFSSWGVPGSLELKPEITAPGGNIYSLNGLEPSGGGYEIMSGTSMAAPQVTGMAALMSQYIRENGLAQKTGMSERHLIQSLLMSTAQPLMASQGVYYPVIQQGAGMANVYDAMSAGSYITMAPGSSSGDADGKVKVELFDDPERTGAYSAVFTLHNLTNEDTTVDLSADFFVQALLSDGTHTYMDYATTMLAMNVAWTIDGAQAQAEDREGMDFNGDGLVNTDDGQTLLDYATGVVTTLTNKRNADVDGDGDIDSYDAYVFLKGLSTSTATLPAGGELTVRVDFSLSEDVKDSLDERFPNGTYIQGYLYAQAGETSHSIPVLGFFGNWSDPSMFDVGQWTTFATGEDTRIPYIGRIRGNDFKVVYDWDRGYNYSFGGNPLIPDSVYMPERNAMNSADSMDGVSFIAIRHADDSRVTVVNETTGEIIMDQQTGAVNMAYYYGAVGWQNSGMTLTTNFSLKDAAEDDVISMDFTLVPEYYIDGEGNVDWEALGNGTTLSTSFVIDNTAPVLSGVSIDLMGNTMTVKASDNNYVAAVGLYNKTGTRCLAQTGAKQDIAKGEQAEYTFSLDKVNGKKFLLQVFDYAMNRTTYLIEMQIGEASDLPTMMAYDLVSRHWCGFDKDFEYDYKVGTNRVAYADHVYYAATIAEHYVFASTNKGELYVMPEDDLTDTTFITDLEMVLYDMAYNMADGEIYAVTETGELVKLHKLTGEVTKVGKIGLNTNTLACSPEGVFYCNELGTGKVYSFTLDTLDAPELLMEDPYLTYVDPIMGADMGGTTGNMGMEYDPNTGKICWNSHCEVLIGSYITYAYFYEIDPVTGEFTRYNDFWHEMSGLIIPVRSGNDQGWADPTDTVLAVKLNKSEIDVIRGTSAQLIANVQPWTATDRTVTWTSADESIATVDQYGVVTGQAEGTTTIRATSNLDPDFYAECTVNVEILQMTLHGTLSDENGDSMFYDWDLSQDKGWTAGAKLEKTMTSATFSQGVNAFYMMDNISGTWAMHKVAADGTVLESAPNTNAIALWDMTYNPYFTQVHGGERISSIYYYYLLSPKDPMAMDAVGFNLGDLADYLVGITSLGYEQQTDENGVIYDTEHLVLLDNDGYVWDFWIYDVETGGMNALYNITKSNLTCEFAGDDTMDNLFTSLMAGDDGSLYLSTFTGTTNEIWHLSYDEDINQYLAVKLGDVGADVWPATITSVTVNGEADANASSPAPMYTMSAAPISDAELKAAGSRASFAVTQAELDAKLGVHSTNALALGKNDLTSGTEYTYTVPADGRMEFSVGSVYNGAGSKQYSWYNGSRVAIKIDGKAMTASSAKRNVTAGQVITVRIESLDGDTYTADMTLKETAAAETLTLGQNAVQQNLEYVYTADQDGTMYVSLVELLYNGSAVTESALGSSVLFTINGSSVSSFNKSFEMTAGDEIAVILKDYSWDGSGVVTATVNLSWEGFFEHPAGSIGNPVQLLYADCPTKTIEIAAGSAAYYALESYYDDSSWSTVYPFQNKTLVVTGENAYVIVGSTRYDAENGAVRVAMGSDTLIQIGNAGSEAAVFDISVEIPEGHKDNPQKLTEGENTVDVPAYGSHYFGYTAEADGTVTVTVSGENWKYNFAHYDAEGNQLSAKDYYAKNGDADTQTLQMKAGESIVVMVGTSKGYSQPGGEITVTFHLDAAPGETPEPQNALVLGKNDLVSGTEYTYTVPADGRMEFAVGSVYNGAGSKQYSWYNNSKVAVKINGKAMTASSAKRNVTAGEVITVLIESLDGDTYTADMTLKELTAAETLTLGQNAISQNLEYVYTADQSGTMYVSVVEMLYNGAPVGESVLGMNVQLTINGSSVSSFNKSYELTAGDEIAIVVKDYSWDGSGVVSAIVNLSWEGFYEHPAGTIGNPVKLMFADCPTKSIEIAAGAAAWYELESYYDDSAWQTVYPFDGKYLVVTGENAFLDVEGTVYNAENGVAKVLMDDETLIQIGNSGSAPAIFDISVEIPEGHKDNPQDLAEGENTVDVPAYGSHYFDFTAAEDGIVTVTVSGENWKYSFTHFGADGAQLSTKDYYFKNGDADTVTLEIKAGESIVVMVGTSKGYSQPGGEITVTFHFELPACEHPNTVTTIENEVPATCTTDGSYDSVVTCADCGEELSRQTVTVPATGHDYQDGFCVICGEPDPNVPDNTVVVEVASDVEVTNGVVNVTWDPAKLTLTGFAVQADYTSVLEGDGSVTFGYVSLHGIPAGKAVATLVFEAVDLADAPVTIVHQQRNNESTGCDHAWSDWTENALGQMERECANCGAIQVNPFVDVPTDAFYLEPVLWAVEQEITNGTTVATFSPDADCNRAQAVTFLWRAAGAPEPTNTVNPFVDVTEEDFFYKAVLWAVEKGITNGVDGTHFGSLLQCNRAQIVTFLWRAEGSPAASGAHSFTDVELGSFYAEAVLWAAQNGIANGMTETTFGPGAVCNRAQVVTFLFRAYA